MTTVKPPPPDTGQYAGDLHQFRKDVSSQSVSATPADPRADFGRIDVVRTVAGLRHIEPSGEPAMVFSHLAAICVPAVCDEVVIDLVEDGRGYRIRRPATGWTALRTSQPAAEAQSSIVLTPDSVTVTIPAAQAVQDEPVFSGSVRCTWTDDYVPTPTDASLLQLMVDHAVALLQHERSGEHVHHGVDSAHTMQGALSRDRRIASAVGVVMALHHVDQAQAMNLLIRISDRSHIDLHELAETVVTTGWLPGGRGPVDSG